MFLAIMQEMTALTERLQILRAVMAWIVIQVRRRQNHPGLPQPPLVLRKIDPIDCPPLLVPPDLSIGVEPTAIAEMMNHTAMGTTTGLATALGPLEPDHIAELPPVDRVETPKSLPDRHPPALASYTVSLLASVALVR